MESSVDLAVPAGAVRAIKTSWRTRAIYAVVGLAVAGASVLALNALFWHASTGKSAVSATTQPTVLGPASLTPYGDVIRTGQQMSVGGERNLLAPGIPLAGERVFWFSHFPANEIRPKTQLSLNMGVLTAANTISVVEGVNAAAADPEGSQLLPGFHALVKTQSSDVIGWYVGGAAAFRSATGQVDSYPWSVDPSVHVIDIPSPAADLATVGGQIRTVDAASTVGQIEVS